VVGSHAAAAGMRDMLLLHVAGMCMICGRCLRTLLRCSLLLPAFRSTQALALAAPRFLQFRVKQTPVGAAPISSAASIERAGLPPMGAATSGVQQLQPVSEVDLGSADELPQRYRSTTLLRRPGEGLPHATDLTRSGKGTQGGCGELSGGAVLAPHATCFAVTHSFMPAVQVCPADSSVCGASI
jgi:hypothetical protein